MNGLGQCCVNFNPRKHLPGLCMAFTLKTHHGMVIIEARIKWTKVTADDIAAVGHINIHSFTSNTNILSSIRYDDSGWRQWMTTMVILPFMRKNNFSFICKVANVHITVLNCEEMCHLVEWFMCVYILYDRPFARIVNLMYILFRLCSVLKQLCIM